MAAWVQIQLTVLLLSGLHHFGQCDSTQSCDKPFMERVVFSRNGEESFSLSLPIQISFSELSTVLWTRKKRVVARMRHNNITVSGNRTSVLSNGTLQLHNINKYDGGVYKMEGHDAVGKCLVREHIWLEVQDPVSRPKVSVSCKGGRLDLRCEAERGDNVSFRWATLGGSVNASLGVTDLLSLEGGDRQELVCVASNMVSTETSDPLKPHCRDAITTTRNCETETIKGYKDYAKLLLQFLCVCGVLLAILCAILCTILCINNRVWEGPNTEGGPSSVQTNVVYAQIHIRDRDKGSPGEGCSSA